MNVHIHFVCENIVQNLKHTTKNNIKVGENLSLNTHDIIVNTLVSQIKLKFATQAHNGIIHPDFFYRSTLPCMYVEIGA